jgi:hypothetical protein
VLADQDLRVECRDDPLVLMLFDRVADLLHSALLSIFQRSIHETRHGFRLELKRLNATLVPFRKIGSRTMRPVTILSHLCGDAI